MASVSVVFNVIKDLANKDQKGFITPAQFNTFAPIAQLNIFNRMFDMTKDFLRNDRAGFNPGKDKSLMKRIREDLSTFATTRVLIKDEGVFNKPPNLSRIISATTNGSILLGQSTRTPIELCYEEEKIDRILTSNISAPTDSFPIALVSDDIEVFPQTINRIRLTYYRLPQGRTSQNIFVPFPPSLASDFSGNILQESSINFDLPDHYTAILVMEIAEMFGINLRDQILEKYAGSEQLLETQQKSF